ncbi:MAG TPA: DNA-binding protein [Porphyromonadaceae bacterium]|jgi:predicted histone-like DNA-binding protein|uniref:HU family DNA-binding protein n=1 Tax=Limibacterium fermenti TaxID=3229863 RepID=UPI000E8D869E|nr:DNA-binding protein [Porphyromonadaceae bacterium]HBK30107.1 DNA-binding protein [Porphyromonadaceae bacterium]HBL33622.1 DNA-binding protein [Porphyromonadaceae bacterium]HBX21303.1 DNA-binding protein [Porphyromonadaceae bacterium]HBX44775.1 DNA-binding protein [Porphyromonadaceae bacterium]
MSIKFKPILRGEPGVVGGGTKKKYYASANISGETTIEDLTKDIEKISTVSGADIRAVLYAMVDVAVDKLAEGKAVRLGDLGSLRPGISSTGVEEKAKVEAGVIKSARVIFTPGLKIKQMLKLVKFEKL